MILARLTRAIREQNWFAVVLEFVIVIAGVVIGFQVTEWRGELADRESEQIYLARLYSDMEQSVCRIRGEQGGVTSWNQRARRTLDALLANDPGAVDDIGFELIASTRIQTGSASRATLNELVSGGQVNLISNEILRAHIAEADARITALGEYIGILINTQSTFVNQVQSRLRPLPGNVYGITYDFEALVEDDMFINSLGHALRVTHTNATWLGRMADVAEELRVAVGEEIGLDTSAGPDCDVLEGAR